MKKSGETSPRTLWPSGTLNLREPRLAQPGNLAQRIKPPRVNVIKPIRPAIKLIRAAFPQPKGIAAPRPAVLHVLVPLASLIRPRRNGL